MAAPSFEVEGRMTVGLWRTTTAGSFKRQVEFDGLLLYERPMSTGREN
jgi:hypothetical protein